MIPTASMAGCYCRLRHHSAAMRARSRVSLLAAAATLAIAPAADAACGAGGAARPKGVSDPPLVIGDSVTVAAAHGLLQMGAAVDARVCRRFGEGLQIMRATRLPSVVVVALGSNPSVGEGQVEQAISLAGPRLLAFVVPRELRIAHSAAGRALRAAARAHPEITLLDWAGESAAHPGWFARDGIHPRGQGVTAFTQLIGSFLAASQLSDGQGFDSQPHTLSDDEVYPELVGSIVRSAFARLEAAPLALVGRTAGAGAKRPAPAAAAESEGDPIAPVRPGRGHLPPWET
jgi:hypothetical protein